MTSEARFVFIGPCINTSAAIISSERAASWWEIVLNCLHDVCDLWLANEVVMCSFTVIALVIVLTFPSLWSARLHCCFSAEHKANASTIKAWLLTSTLQAQEHLSCSLLLQHQLHLLLPVALLSNQQAPSWCPEKSFEVDLSSLPAVCLSSSSFIPLPLHPPLLHYLGVPHHQYHCLNLIHTWSLSWITSTLCPQLFVTLLNSSVK